VATAKSLIRHPSVSAGDDGNFLGGEGRINAVTDQALLSLLDEVRLSGDMRFIVARVCTAQLPMCCGATLLLLPNIICLLGEGVTLWCFDGEARRPRRSTA
jgi:hypothetical protein